MNLHRTMCGLEPFVSRQDPGNLIMSSRVRFDVDWLSRIPNGGLLSSNTRPRYALVE